MAAEESEVRAGLNVDQPNSARMYDYQLDGAANFAVDRDAVDRIISLVGPEITFYLQNNRAFLWRAVRWLAREAGVDQFLDLGSGIPTRGNVHEIAHAENPHARVAYVDFEPIAVAHARQLLGPDEQRVTMTQADLREPDTVLAADGVAGLLDFHRPIAVLAVGVLPFLHDDTEIQQLLAHYRDATVAGSYLALSHISPFSWEWDQIQHALDEVVGQTATPERVRSREAIAALMPGYDLVDPGLVPTVQWRPAHALTEDEIARSNCYAAIGRH